MAHSSHVILVAIPHQAWPPSRRAARFHDEIAAFQSDVTIVPLSVRYYVDVLGLKIQSRSIEPTVMIPRHGTRKCRTLWLGAEASRTERVASRSAV